MKTSGPASGLASVFLTGLAWVIIVVSALLIPISAIALLMLLARSHGSASATFTGFLTVVVAPPAAFVVGIGLLKRRAWAWVGVLALLAGLIALNVHTLMTARPTTTTHTSPSGTKTTVMASGPNYHSRPIIAVCAALMGVLVLPPVRRACGVSRPRPRKDADADANVQVAGEPVSFSSDTSDETSGGGWRVGHLGRDRMYYEERHGLAWQRIEIDGEMLMGKAHHVIYFAPPHVWQAYPEWARHRRGEIMARIKSVFRPPDYEYYGDGETTTATPVPVVPAALVQPHRIASAMPKATVKQLAALWLAIVLLLSITALMGWLVTTGVSRGTTYFPSKRASQQRVVTRQQEPITFWISISVYAAIGLGTGGLGLWATGAAIRER